MHDNLDEYAAWLKVVYKDAVPPRQESYGPADKACLGKKRYDEYEAAEAAAVWLREQFGREVTVYHCRYCDGWHIGHDGRKRHR